MVEMLVRFRTMLGRPWIVAVAILALPIALVFATSLGDYQNVCKISAGCLTVPPERGVLENARDSDGDPLSAVLVRTATNGTLFLLRNGSYTYKPYPGFHGQDSFEYITTDGITDSEVNEVTILINEAPTAMNDEYWIDENSTLELEDPGILLNDFDADGDVFVAALVEPPAHGTRVVTETGGLIYRPYPGFIGIDEFTYQLWDGFEYGDPGRVTIHVTKLFYTAAVARDDIYYFDHNISIDEDHNMIGGTFPLYIDKLGILVNDTKSKAPHRSIVIMENPTNGLLELNNNGNFSYIPNDEFIGTDSFVYRSWDGIAHSNEATVTLLASIEKDDPPIVRNIELNLIEDDSFTLKAPGLFVFYPGHFFDLSSLYLIHDVDNGTLTIENSGALLYTPDPDFSGTDTFVFTVMTQLGAGLPIYVRFTVDRANYSPTASEGSSILNGHD
jgi:hypothetical protein